MFDEMVNWYSPLKITKNGRLEMVMFHQCGTRSQLISGPQESSINESSNTPWKGILKFSNIFHDNFQTSSRNSHVDGESSDS